MSYLKSLINEINSTIDSLGQEYLFEENSEFDPCYIENVKLHLQMLKDAGRISGYKLTIIDGNLIVDTYPIIRNINFKIHLNKDESNMAEL